MKYNDNGTYRDIYVKSFDTLPVGTEVDYDGNTVPTGWTEISPNLVIDSGDEGFTTTAGYVDATITFNKTFTSPPAVMLTLISDTTNVNYKEMAYMVRTNTISTTGFQIRVISSQANLYPRISWLAIGK